MAALFDIIGFRAPVEFGVIFFGEQLVGRFKPAATVEDAVMNGAVQVCLKGAIKLLHQGRLVEVVWLHNLLFNHAHW